MDWHYTEAGQQHGPVTEEQVLHLAQTGVITPDTLIWHHGMTEWKPFREAGPNAPPPLPSTDANAPSRFCTSCGSRYPLTELAFFGESAICANCKPAWTQRVLQGMTTTSPTQFRYAGFWIRAGALFIDGLISTAVFGTLFALFFGGAFIAFIQAAAQAGARGGAPPDPALLAPMMAGMGLFQLLSFLASLAYFVFFVVKYGATPGKMALGLKIITPSGGPISIGRAIGRYFANILSALILYIGYMMAGWDSEKRALHDRLADTRVIHTR